MSPEANEPRGGDVRQTLIDAALAVVSEVGIAKTTTRRIAEAAGLPLGSLHYWFASKEELLDAVAAHLLDGVSRTLAADAPRATLAAQLDWLLESSLSAPVDAHLAFYDITGYAIRRGNVQLTRRMQQHIRVNCERALEPWRQTLETQRPGSFEPLVVLVKGYCVGAWFAHVTQDRSDLVGSLRYLGELLGDIPRVASASSAPSAPAPSATAA